MTSTIKNILIAEDDPVLREAYLRRFARTSFKVRTAENGEEAVSMIKAQVPDLLICDIMMPVQDGIWVLEQFPKDDRKFPVIMLTNFGDDATRDRCKALGMDGYLVKKDMSLATLVEMAENFVQKAPTITRPKAKAKVKKS